MINKNEIIVHFHIGKTGGISLRHILKKKFKDKLKYLTINKIHAGNNDFYLYQDFIKNINNFEFQCISGHIPFGIHRYLNKKTHYITILRDPVKRIISDYNYVINEKEHPFNKYYIAKNLISFEDYIEIDITKNKNILPPDVFVGSGVHNLQSRSISGEMFNNLNDFRSNSFNLNTAFKNIENHFLLIGVLDYFDQFLYLLKEKFNFTIYDIINIKSNASKKTIQLNNLDKSIIKRIELLNSDDIYLYEQIKINFEKKMINLLSNRKYFIYKTVNKSYNIYNKYRFFLK